MEAIVDRVAGRPAGEDRTRTLTQRIYALAGAWLRNDTDGFSQLVANEFGPHEMLGVAVAVVAAEAQVVASAGRQQPLRSLAEQVAPHSRRPEAVAEVLAVADMLPNAPLAECNRRLAVLERQAGLPVVLAAAISSLVSVLLWQEAIFGLEASDIVRRRCIDVA